MSHQFSIGTIILCALAIVVIVVLRAVTTGASKTWPPVRDFLRTLRRVITDPRFRLARRRAEEYYLCTKYNLNTRFHLSLFRGAPDDGPKKAAARKDAVDGLEQSQAALAHIVTTLEPEDMEAVQQYMDPSLSADTATFRAFFAEERSLLSHHPEKAVDHVDRFVAMLAARPDPASKRPDPPRKDDDLLNPGF
ncbi:MAG: hypothetical protein RLZZ324_489 [Candidatus Parcubacteria bacterium]|jgi:hypothetical protein